MTAIVESISGWITKTKTKSQFGKQQNQIFLLNQIGYPWATLAPGGWLAIHGKSRSMTCLSMNEIRSPMGATQSNQNENQIKVQEIGRRWLDEVEAVCTLQLNPPDLSVAKGSFLCILEKNPCRSSEQKSQSQGSSTIANLAKTKIDLLKVQIQLHWFWLWLWKFVLLVLFEIRRLVAEEGT
jgi:hypothetical protein